MSLASLRRHPAGTSRIFQYEIITVNGVCVFLIYVAKGTPLYVIFVVLVSPARN
jgi:hypothetical protein